MKKRMLTTFCAFALILTSCGSDDDGADCITQTNDVVNAISDFDFNNFSVENCNSLKSTLQSYLDSGCAPDQETENSFRQTLETLGDCSIQ